MPTFGGGQLPTNNLADDGIIRQKAKFVRLPADGTDGNNDWDDVGKIELIPKDDKPTILGEGGDDFDPASAGVAEPMDTVRAARLKADLRNKLSGYENVLRGINKAIEAAQTRRRRAEEKSNMPAVLNAEMEEKDLKVEKSKLASLIKDVKSQIASIDNRRDLDISKMPSRRKVDFTINFGGEDGRND